MLSLGLEIGTMALAARRKWQPQSLFAAGGAGALYDASDLSSLFQDAAGTVAVTAPGQPVGRMLDRSGNGCHLVQATPANCPEYRRDAAGRGYLFSDGAGDILQAGFNGWAAPSALYWAGKSTASSAAGIVGIGVQYNATACRFGTLGTAIWTAAVPTADNRESLASAAGGFSALALRGVRASASLIEAVHNGVVTAAAAPAASLGTARTGQICLGSTGYQGEFYTGLLIARALSSTEASRLFGWMAQRAGISV